MKVVRLYGFCESGFFLAQAHVCGVRHMRDMAAFCAALHKLHMGKGWFVASLLPLSCVGC